MNIKHFGAALAAVVFVGISPAQAGDGMYAGVYGRDNVNGLGTALDLSAGGYAGYNYAFGTNLVAGVEGELDYDWSSAWNASAADTTATASVRLGYDAGAATVYGKAGAGYATSGTAAWSVAAGVDVDLFNSYFLRVEGERADPLAAGLNTRYNLKTGVGINF